MPQMAPISWISLFILFSASFMIFNTLNYFCFFNKKKQNNFNDNKESNTKNMKNNFNWKW